MVKKPGLLTIAMMVMASMCLLAQNNEVMPDLSNFNDTTVWVAFNRTANYDNVLYLSSYPGDGFLRLNNLEFSNGRIELEVRGKDEQGRSFVGLAFHGVNDSTYDAIYFRPFNFKNPERNGNSVQYISHPEFSWSKLREEFPGKYENPVVPVPDPNDWFHVTISIKKPVVEVYVNHSEISSLRVEQLSLQESGWIGLWVGNNSDGYFRNLKITTE
jgi:hypothetical protein